ncbi:MAG: serine/threonine-protein kinase [Candidatus Acidiferrales bacterium]|jgi:predicted Ser/Thr protein kinase
MTDESIPQRIGDYEVLGVLGNGGMGKVYKVRNVISDRVDAMKILLPNLAGQKDLTERFLREVKVLASLNHPNIAALRTAFMDNDRLVMIMEYVEGETLASRCARGPVPIADSLHYVDSVLAALGYAHQHNVIHRDIKPGNIMITPDGTVKLMDFGIAHSENNADLTKTGTALGSVRYMSPEQIQGGPIDARSDIYSLGVTLYELVTGEPPFKTDSDVSLLAAHLNQIPRRPIELRPDLPQGLNDIIVMALAKDPAKRFQTADAFRNALHSVSDKISATSATTAPISAPPPAAMAAAAAVAAAPASVSAAPIPTAPLPPAAQPQRAASAAMPQAYVPPTATAQPPSHRGRYIALGAAIVLVVLVAAGISVPRWIKARAGNNAAGSALTGAPQQAGATTPTGDPNAAPNPNAAPSGSTAPGDTTNAPPGAAPNSGLNSAPPAGNPPPDAPPVNPVPMNPAPAAPAANIAPPPPSPRPARHSMNAAPQQAPPPDNSVNAPPQASPDSAQLNELEHQIDQASGRAAAVKSSLDTMKEAMSRQGLGLRGDIVASEARMNNDLAKADSALQAGDTARAKTYLDQAETELGKLEAFLGR